MRGSRLCGAVRGLIVLRLGGLGKPVFDFQFFESQLAQRFAVGVELIQDPAPLISQQRFFVLVGILHRRDERKHGTCDQYHEIALCL